MKNEKAKPNDVYRDELKEHRGHYYVIYQPADSRVPFAQVSLTFPERYPDENGLRRLMEGEAKRWLARYPVPLMLSSFDSTESLIHLSDERASHQLGYTHPQTGEPVTWWGPLENRKLPTEDMTADDLARVYKDVPFRRRQDVVSAVDEENRKFRVGVRIINAAIIFIAAIPLAIELIGMGVAWLGHILSVVSIATGFFKVAKAAGWIRSPKSAQAKEEKKRKMEHYYYHCEKNPEGFSRLLCENFERDAKERTRQESAEIAVNNKNKLPTVQEQPHFSTASSSDRKQSVVASR